MVYTVKQLSDLAGVSPRTLHFYDEIGLLKPAAYGENGYRYYDETALLQLQQILFFRELDLSLKEIAQILGQPGFDRVEALQVHRQVLVDRVERLKRLIHTVDKTILHLQGEGEMSQQDYFEGFSPEQEKEYADEARRRWGSENVDESNKRWNNYSPEKKKQILENGGRIMQAVAGCIGKDPASSEVQKLVGEWHQNIGNFYNCTYEILEGLGRLYVEDPAFRATFEKVNPALPEFFQQAIAIYCQGKTG